MSFSVDANILLYASDESSPWHDRAKRFLVECSRSHEPFYLTWPVVFAYLRIVTHPTALPRPLQPVTAEANVASLLGLPHCRLVTEEEGFWSVYRRVTQDAPARGNLVPDAHVAAILLQHGVRRFYTRDRDFRRFDFLDVRDPVAGD